jgi:hypothetical protein
MFRFPLLPAACLAALVLPAAPALRAQGAPPMNTNDPDTPGNGHWELNLPAAHTRTAAGKETEFPVFDLNYGIGETVQVSYAVSWLTANPAGGPRESGWTNSALGCKWRFKEAGKDGFAMSVYPAVEFNNPGSSAERKGLVERGGTFALPVQVAREFGACTLNLEAGRVFHFQAADEWFYGVALGRDFTESVTAGVELFGTAAKDFSRSALLLNFGLNVRYSPRYSLLVAAGRELHRHDGDRATFTGLLGWQWRL